MPRNGPGEEVPGVAAKSPPRPRDWRRSLLLVRKGWDVKNFPMDGDIGGCIASALVGGGKELGALFGQNFYAVRASGEAVSFPFSSRPFTALIEIAAPVDGEILASCARTLIRHGCVHAVCRGEKADRLNDIFIGLAEEGRVDKGGVAFTSMHSDDETLGETLQYFILPSGLASTGLLVVIGDSRDFRSAVDDFIASAGTLGEGLREPVGAGEELVPFGTA